MNEVVSPVRPHVHHVALTVSDLDASVAWYEEVFAVGYLMDAPHEGVPRGSSPIRSGRLCSRSTAMT